MTEVLWNRMTAEELRQKAVYDAIVLLPVASTEQHGPHLATGVRAFDPSTAMRDRLAQCSKAQIGFWKRYLASIVRHAAKPTRFKSTDRTSLAA